MKRAALVLVGAYLCIAGSFVHRQTFGVGVVDLPWGLALTIACTYAVVLGGERLTTLGGAWIGAGWAIALLAQQIPPVDSILVASDWLGWSFLAGSLGAIVIGVSRAPRLGR